MPEKIYFPVLRWKEGEQNALSQLDDAVKERIMPIIDFPADCDFRENRVQNFCNSAAEHWGVNRPFYVDVCTIYCDFTPETDEDEHPVFALLRDICNAGLESIPVIRPDVDDEILEAIRDALDEGYVDNVALRIIEDEDGQTPAPEYTRDAIASLNLTAEQVDLILDLQDVNGRIDSQIRDLRSWVSTYGNTFRRSIMVGGAIPSNLYEHVNEDTSGTLPRHDWTVWLRTQGIQELSHLKYGDYTTVQSILPSTAFAGSPRIKYTLAQNWLVSRGHKQRRGENQRQVLAGRITSHADFRGETYSFGDRRILECANGNWGPGNNAQWVSIDINQHITFVTNQLNAILAGI